MLPSADGEHPDFIVVPQRPVVEFQKASQLLRAVRQERKYYSRCTGRGTRRQVCSSRLAKVMKYLFGLPVSLIILLHRGSRTPMPPSKRVCSFLSQAVLQQESPSDGRIIR